MVKQIVHDILFLGQKSEEATEEDKQVITDLHDTLTAHREVPYVIIERNKKWEKH